MEGGFEEAAGLGLGGGELGFEAVAEDWVGAAPAGKRLKWPEAPAWSNQPGPVGTQAGWNMAWRTRWGASEGLKSLLIHGPPAG